MKKYLITAALVLMLSGCGKNRTDTVFSLTDEQTEEYKAQIADVLTEDSWGYNPNTIVFAQSVMPEEGDSLYSQLDTFTSDGGLKASAYANKAVVQATVPLQHINGSNVGTAYFYFADSKPVCEYYVYKDKYYSLKSKNPFELNNVLTAYESTDKTGSFKTEKLNTAFTAAFAVNNGITATVAENDTALYYDGTNKFKICAKADFTGRGLIPMDITLGDNFGTILLGERVKVQQSEDENEVSDTVNEPPAKSVSIAITNNKGKPSGVIIPTTVSSFTSIAQYGDRLFLARDKAIDEFVYGNGNLTKANTYVLDHYVSRIRLADIDGNGTVEFIVSDGTNIYIYEKTATFNLIWRSNSYLSSISGNIYAGDLNCDGVRELYITDSIGVTARYILTPQGFKISGGGIASGNDDSYIIADFNNDGKDDYMVIPTGNDKTELYIAE